MTASWAYAVGTSVRVRSSHGMRAGLEAYAALHEGEATGSSVPPALDRALHGRHYCRVRNCGPRRASGITSRYKADLNERES
jgi:hypothetical protein